MKLDDDDFALMGLPRQFALERAELDRRWRELQTQVHPDRFAAEGAAAQRLAMQWAVRVNEAYARLKTPLSRAAYLCELRGAPINAERNTAMPPAFLMQQMTWREALDDARTQAAVESLDADVNRAEAELLRQAGQCLDVDGDAEAASGHVRSLMFIARFRADVARRIDALDP